MSHGAPSLAILGCRGIPARYGGFETFAEELSARLVARGFPVTVYCLADGAQDAPREHRGVRLEHVAVPPLGPARALVYDVLALRRARRHDVVYMLGYGAGAFLGLGRRRGNEVWVNMDGLEWRRSKWNGLARAWLRRMEAAALRRADRLVFDSAAGLASVLGAGDRSRACVIEYGAELDLEHEPHVLESLGLKARGYFLLVARIEPENHVLEVVRAHARTSGVPELLVVGDLERAGRYGERCRAAAGRGTRFLGAVYDRATLHALRHASAAVVHGHSVGGTNPSLLEALAAGAHVLAHENPFNREVLGGPSGFRNEDELVELLAAAAQLDESERATIAARHRARIRERYTWERIAAEYATLLAPAAPRGEPRAPAVPESVAAALPKPRTVAPHGAKRA